MSAEGEIASGWEARPYTKKIEKGIEKQVCKTLLIEIDRGKRNQIEAKEIALHYLYIS